MPKPDQKALLKASRGTQPGDVAHRFELADAAMAAHPDGLLRKSFRAETALTDQQGFTLDLALLHDNPFNARAVYNADTIKELAQSLAVSGQKVPALVARHPDREGHYVLIDGEYRKRALLSLGKTEIKCVLLEVAGLLAFYQQSYLVNEQRNPHCPLDNALAWKRLLDEQLMPTADAIGLFLGISKGTVAKTLALLDLPAAAVEKLRETPTKYGLAVGYELTRCAKIMSESDLLALMDRIVADDLSSRQLEALRSQRETKKTRKTKEFSRQYKLRDGAKTIGVLKEWDSGKVSLEITLLDQEARASLVSDLKKRLGLPSDSAA